MRYNKINSKLFVKNRKKFFKNLKPGSLAVINSNYTYPTNADANYPFCQNSNLLYLSGITQENTSLLIYKDKGNENIKEILFIEKHNPISIIWDGPTLSKEEAKDISGIENIKWDEDFKGIFSNLVYNYETIYINLNEHKRNSSKIKSREIQFLEWCQKKYPLHKYERLSPIIAKLRTLKEKEEIKTIRDACNITKKGFEKVLKSVKPGIMEYEIEAEFIYTFTKNSSEGFAYSPIVASGKNACILHYIKNNNKCKDGDMILLDVGARYANYCSDVTRTIPVNGKFTTRQKKVYTSVLNILKKSKELIKIGLNFKEYRIQSTEIVKKELIDLGLLKRNELLNKKNEIPKYKKFFMHGITHHLGLDTHDDADYDMNFSPGMVITIEPGIYIQEEEIGIRLEDNIVVQKDGIETLTEDIPIEIEEIESIMNYN